MPKQALVHSGRVFERIATFSPGSMPRPMSPSEISRTARPSSAYGDVDPAVAGLVALRRGVAVLLDCQRQQVSDRLGAGAQTSARHTGGHSFHELSLRIRVPCRF